VKFDAYDALIKFAEDASERALNRSAVRDMVRERLVAKDLGARSNAWGAGGGLAGLLGGAGIAAATHKAPEGLLGRVAAGAGLGSAVGTGLGAVAGELINRHRAQQRVDRVLSELDRRREDLSKWAEEITEYDQYGLPIRQTKPSSPVPAMALGGAAGVLGAHYLLPTREAKSLRDAAKSSLDPAAAQPLRDAAMRSNAPRVLGGVGAGLLGGYLLHKFLS
jgi:hypothetical protein